MQSLKLIVGILLFTIASLRSDAQDNANPTWISQGNIYEVNVRQYTPEGTFKAFEKSLPRLKDMGVQTLWFMPINPISKKDRKGTLGSYYAISNYEAINPEYGTMADWKALVNKAHSMGFKVIIDWVANHTGADHYWMQTHPDFYTKDSAGKFVVPYDWFDTRKLNYANPELADSMITQMNYWITQSNIDGFRCDVAGDVPDAFWARCIATLRKQKTIFMLAEGEKAALNKDGFNATYSWSVFNVMKDIVKGDKNANELDSAINTYDTAFPPNALHLYFTSNHDENSWNKADFGTMPGKTHAPFAVLTQTIKSNVPLIYSGQEEPVLRALSFFEKDTIIFSKYQRAAFYKKLLLLRKYNPALAYNASFKRIETTNNKDVYAYIRRSGNRFVFVLLNLSGQKQTIKLKEFASSVINTATVFDVMKGINKENVFNAAFNLEPWDYTVISDADPATAKILAAIK